MIWRAVDDMKGEWNDDMEGEWMMIWRPFSSTAIGKGSGYTRLGS